jgi:hypothetical protein
MKTYTLSPKGYIQLLEARLGACASVAPEERRVAVRHDVNRNTWLIRRAPEPAEEKSLFGDTLAFQPIPLLRGGAIELFVRLRQPQKGHVEIAHYRIAFLNLPINDNGVHTLRYDQSVGQPHNDGWDNDLMDNPEHPWAHLHVNFAHTQAANALRLLTSHICPILLLRNFNHWYYDTYIR